MGYVQAAKLAGKIILVLGVVVSLEYDGYTRANRKWTIKAQDYLLEQQKKVDEANKKASEETVKSSMLAQTIEAMQNEAQQKIDQLTAVNNKLFASVPKRAVCVKNRVPKNSYPVIPVESSAIGELSTEFKDFLISESRRGDEIGIYATLSHQWAKELCKNDNVVCPNIAAD